MSRYLVLDMGGTYIKYALMNEYAEILEKGRFPAVTNTLEACLESVAEGTKQFAGKYEAVAVSMPGRIDTERGIAHTGGSFQFFNDTPFGALLEERLGKPVTLANDGKCAVMAELRTGALRDYQNAAVFVIGTGIGGGIFLNRKVWMGTTGGAGEFSWLLSNFRAAAEQGLSWGTVGNLIWAHDTSAPGLIRMYAERKNEDPANYTGQSFFEKYDEGDPDAKAALEEFGKITASGLLTLQAVLDLECYAIGGGISARSEITDIIRKCLYDRYEEFPHLPYCRPEIVPCRFGNDANLIGALGFHLEKTEKSLEQ
ncbi:MAG: ROK family protein [Solobacterium sp.]|nr:ROK family protein [Solobacterium sp.]